MNPKIDLDFVLLNDKNEYPYELLLLADETEEAIAKYIHNSKVYVAKNNGNTIAVFCLYELDENTVELKNIAVSESFQNKGIGSRLISFIKELVKVTYSKLIVGTADSGIDQIRFYERNGFKKFGLRKNFFIENYELPIIENGIQLKDMILLSYDL